MKRPQKVSIFAASAAAAALMLLPRLEGAQQQPAIRTGDQVYAPPQTRIRDFDQTIVGKAELKSEAQANECFTAAVSLLATQRAALQKQCSDANGNFNTGTLTAGLHSEACTVSQMVTCTGTDASRDQNAARQRAQAEQKTGDPVGPKTRKTSSPQ